jgi:hypothetical protein
MPFPPTKVDMVGPNTIKNCRGALSFGGLANLGRRLTVHGRRQSRRILQ